MPEISEELKKSVRDAAYVAIGLGVIGVQKAQVRRRELVQLLEARKGLLGQPLEEARKEVARRLTDLDEAVGRVFERIDKAVEPVAERLPEPAKTAIGQLRDTREHLRDYLRHLAA